MAVSGQNGLLKLICGGTLLESTFSHSIKWPRGRVAAWTLAFLTTGSDMVLRLAPDARISKRCAKP